MMKSIFAICAFVSLLGAGAARAEEAPLGAEVATQPVAVDDVTSDKKIERRLTQILSAVGNYSGLEVTVLSGVVILSGSVEDDAQLEWARKLATRLDGVVAVRSHVTVESKGLLDFTPAREEIGRLGDIVMRHLPVIVLSLLVLALSFGLFFFAASGFRRAFVQRVPSPLLLNALAKLCAVPVFLLGLYLALRISGLTGLALTLLGGTGLLGLALGLGLKNGFEDYAAGLILSIKKPFRPSDWVKIGEFEGIIQQLNSRSTLIMDFIGNHILIPNSIVYRSIITNKSANPKMRGDFVVGIDYADSIDDAQELVLRYLASSSFVLKDPEPWVLVDELGGSAVNLRVYFWVNVREVSIFKVSSHLQREVKKILLARGFRFPDPQREVIFMSPLDIARARRDKAVAPAKPESSSSVSLEDVRTEAHQLNRLARESDLPNQGKDIL